MAKVRERRMQANYIDIGGETPSFAFMGTGFTDANEKPAAKTSSKRYINDKSETKSITGYDLSLIHI